MKAFLLHYFVLIKLLSADGKDMYCAENNCYDLLGVNKSNTKTEITKAFRKLARENHPDKHKGDDAKEASDRFQKIVMAYDVLSDDVIRKNYDDMLADPSAAYQHYMRYHMHKIRHKLDIRLVVLISILLISAIQYLKDFTNNRRAIKYLSNQPKYRSEAIRIATEEKKFPVYDNLNKKEKKMLTKADIKKKEREIIEHIISKRIDIGGGQRPPSIKSTICVQMFLFPYYVISYVYKFMRWQLKYRLLQQNYTQDDKSEMIAYNLGMSISQYNYLDVSKRDKYFDLKLWDKAIFKSWNEEVLKKEKYNQSQSGKYKQQLRTLKKPKSSPMFED